jgi:hypothetical protein
MSSAPRIVQVPLFSFFAETQCDKNGNLFFHTDSGGFYTRTEILRISSDGEEGQKFTLSGKYADVREAAFTSFSVTPDGDLYVLAWGAPGEAKAHVFRFDDDGTMKNPSTLDVPENIVPLDLVAWDDQSVLFTGYYDEKAPKNIAGKQYAALFDATGKLRKELKLSLPDVDLASVGQKLREGGAARSEDAKLYLLEPKNVIVATSTGELLKRISFNKPDPESIASNIRVSGSLISIGFLTFSDKGNVVKKEFLVLDATTGEPFGLYQPAPELGTDEACFSINEGYTFVVPAAKGHRNIFKAALR